MKGENVFNANIHQTWWHNQVHNSIYILFVNVQDQSEIIKNVFSCDIPLHEWLTIGGWLNMCFSRLIVTLFTLLSMTESDNFFVTFTWPPIDWYSRKQSEAIFENDVSLTAILTEIVLVTPTPEWHVTLRPKFADIFKPFLLKNIYICKKNKRHCFHTTYFIQTCNI